MYYFEILSISTKEGFSVLILYFIVLENYMNRSHKYLFIYLFLDQLIFCINYLWNLIIYKLLDVLSLFSYYPVRVGRKILRNRLN